MNAKKRATKKTAARKTARKQVAKKVDRQQSSSTKRRVARQQPRDSPPSLIRFVSKLIILVAIVFASCIGIYHFGSYSLKDAIHQWGIKILYPIRSADWMPEPLAFALDKIHDRIPSSEGLIIDGGELEIGDTPLIAGIPQTRKAVRILNNQSNINLFDEKQRQSLCVAYRVTDGKSNPHDSISPLLSDPRVPNLLASDMTLNEWAPRSIAPAAALAKSFSEIGIKESSLVSNQLPMRKSFADSLWKRLIDEVTVNYPKRFETIWIYAGPIYSIESPKLASGISIPDAVYLIALDMTDSGGLRSIAFILPTEDSKTNKLLSHYVTSIQEIEKRTGLHFLPDLAFDSKDLFLKSISPQLW